MHMSLVNDATVYHVYSIINYLNTHCKSLCLRSQKVLNFVDMTLTCAANAHACLDRTSSNINSVSTAITNEAS